MPQTGQPSLTHVSLNLNEAATLRQQASDLLARLQADRESAERRLAETGRRDPIKSITGATALDQAITSTLEMIEHMDLLLAGGAVQHRLSNGNGKSNGRHAVAGAAARAENGQASRLPVAVAGPGASRSHGMLAGQRPVAATA